VARSGSKNRTPNHDRPIGPIAQSSWLDNRGRDWGVEIRWAVFNGRYEPVSIEFYPRRHNTSPVTHEVIKRCPLGSILRHARRQHAELALAAADWPEFKGRAAEQAEEAIRFGARRGVALTPEDLRHIADIYRTAFDERQPVTAAVAAAFGISQSTAGKRIMAARRAGLLDGIGGRR
jgi:hypothetical protein